MNYPHRIRLRGPWECELLARDNTPIAHRQVTLQVTKRFRLSDAGIREHSGPVRLRRRYGYPGRIDDFERVWLTISGLNAATTIFLNRQTLGSCKKHACFWEFEITSLLAQRNELTVVLEALNDDYDLWEEVALEVRRTAYLRNTRAQRIKHDSNLSAIQVYGDVVGVSERPLDLYLLVDNRTAAYSQVTPAVEGTKFELIAENVAAEPDSIIVELVDGGVVWYSKVLRAEG